MARTLVHNGMVYELSDDVAERFVRDGVIVADPDGVADFIVPLSHVFDEVEAFATPAKGSARHGHGRVIPIAVSGRGGEGQR